MYRAKRNIKEYQNRRQLANPGVQHRLDIFRDDEELDEVEDADDVDEIIDCESDFMRLAEQHKLHEKEVEAMHQKMKKMIVKQQLSDNNQPSFITYAEKEQIKFLYETDSKQYSPEILSESFPVLPETIRKIIKPTWVPKSVKDILRYDNMVLQNWKKYRTGELALDVKMAKHLKKFENRKIVPTDIKVAKRLVPPKFEFPKPQSVTFSRLLTYINPNKSEKVDELKNNSSDYQSHMNKNTHDQNFGKSAETDINAPIKESNLFQIHGQNKNENFVTNIQETGLVEHEQEIQFINNEKNVEFRNRHERMKLDDFLSSSIHNSPSDSTSPKEIVMRDVYRKRKNAEDERLFSTPISKELEIKEEKKTVNKQVAEVEELKTSAELANEKFNEYLINKFGNLADTGVVEWIRKEEDEEVDIVHCIKIPKNKYKKGMTYRVKDCFYDDDGLFLYRVPGLKF